MKMIYILIVVLLVGATAFYLSNRNKSAVKNDSQGHGAAQSKAGITNDNPYGGLRNMAFTTSPEELGLKLKTDQTTVYGVVMDFGMGGGVATIVSYQTGDASLYISTGGGIIGGGKHENVNSAAKHFIALAQKYLDKTVKTEATPLPQSGNVKFYLLTNKGVYLGEGRIKDFENNLSVWSEMFFEGNKVLTELRLAGGN